MQGEVPVQSDLDVEFIGYWQGHVNMLLNQAKSAAWADVLPAVEQFAEVFPAAFTDWLQQFPTAYYDEAVWLCVQNLQLSIEELRATALAERDELGRIIMVMKKRSCIEDAYGE